MTLPAALPVTSRPAAPRADVLCDVCPHPEADHDAIARRFCRATRATAPDRGCVCRAG